MKKITSLMMLLLFVCASAFAQLPELNGLAVQKGESVATMTPDTQWYLVWNKRVPQGATDLGGGYFEDRGAGQRMYMTNGVAAFQDGMAATDAAKYLVRFLSDGEDTNGNPQYIVQFATGNYVNTVSTTKNQSEATPWNVYNINGEEYHFGMNVAPYGARIDQNGQGNTVATWGSGVLTETGGNNDFTLYAIELVEASETELALGRLAAVLADYTANHPIPEDDLVGDSYGQYSLEAAQAYAAALEYASDIIDAEGGDLEVTEIDAAAQAIKDAWDALVASRKPFSTFVAPGYYVIKSAFDFSKSTETEPSEDPETGETIPGTTVTKHFAKAIYEEKGAAKWKTFEPKADFLFKVEASETENIYKVTNMLNGMTFVNIAQSAATAMSVNDNLISFDWRSDSEMVYANEDDETPTKAVPVVNIRLSTGAERAYQYAHCGGHGGGAGVSGNIVGWSTDMAGIGATDWYLDPVDEATALAWIEAASPVKTITAMIDSVEVIKAAFPNQKTIAEDNSTHIESNNPLIKDATQFHSPMTTDDTQTNGDIEAVYPFLLDGNTSTYWHSRWEDGAQPNGTHYLQVSDIDAESVAFVMTRRPVNNDHPTSMSVWGYDTDNDELAKDDGVLLAELEMPFTSNTEVITSAPFLTQGKTVLRFYAESTQGSTASGSNRGYWHCSEFQIYPATGGYYYGDVNKTQAHVRANEIAAVEAAIATWNAGNYSLENVTDPNDAAFLAAYNAVVEAYAAWTKVYADPAPLRNAINDATAFAEMIVTGTNPGQWPEGAGADAIEAAKAVAEAYDMTGAYTPETMAEEVEKMKAAKAEVAGAAIQVVPGKWYTIRFATEDEYEEYGWDKNGAVSEVHGDLYETYVAPANRTEYTGTNSQGNEVTMYDYEAADEIFKGQNLRFMRGADDSYFRFVEVEGGMALQHACGWYVSTGGTLTDAPALMSTEAIGYGKSLIKMRQMDGQDINAGGTPSYMHAQVAGHQLVAWAATAIDSRSALYIEEADDATVADCQEKLLPGLMKFTVSPVGVSYTSSEVQLYTFDGYETVEGGIKVAFSATDKAEAGKAVLMVVDGEYPEKVTDETERLAVDLTLGNELAAVPDSTQALVGTYKYQWVAEADTLHTVTIFQNKMQMANGEDNTDCARDISAYTGAIDLTLAEAIDTKDKDMVIEITGNVDPTAIKEVVAKALNANGKIYTIDGKYVGNGNIGTARNMGTGIYIINGVKIYVK